MQKIKLNIQRFASGTIEASESSMSGGTCKMEWSSSPIDNTNQSYLNVVVYARRTSGSTGLFCTLSGTVTADTKSSSFSKYRGSNDRWTTEWKEVGRIEDVKVSHNEDGTKSVKISCSVTGDTNNLNGTAEASATVTLDQINRASKLNKIEDFLLTDAIQIGITKYINDAIDSLEIKLGNTLIKTVNNVVNNYELSFTNDEQEQIKGLMSSPKVVLTFLLTTKSGNTTLGTSSQTARAISFSKPVAANFRKKNNGHYLISVNGPANDNAEPLQVYDDKGDDLLFYQPGDTFECDYDVIMSGYITSGATGVRVSFPSPKRLDNINSITCQSFKCEARGIKGYLNGEAGSIEFAGRSGYTISINKSNNNVINFLIIKSSAWTNVDNNTPVVFVAYKGYLKLTFN